NAGRYLHQLSEIRSELYRSPQTSYSLDELAASVNLSKSYFQHLYKDLFGCSVSSDMINSRLEYAKYLLDNSSLSIGGIAKMCGYENETHFMRQLQKIRIGHPERLYEKESSAPALRVYSPDSMGTIAATISKMGLHNNE
ncbi:AraC family transcriptional regulator, partial [Paenibacillus sp. AR247]|uniref:helix-turn-helix domain-containing protein n=1 Tax=Paenibacillus sp. AR247 TaxID=1631599 RepID=UPI002157AC31